jgi:hypothetical protein
MNYTRIIYYILLIVLISTVACEREATNVILPEYKQKLAITSFISPSDAISYFFVTSNQRIYGNLGSEETPGNLTAFISDGSTEVALDTTKTGFKISREKMGIKHGKTYKLRVISDKGLSAEASSTVPVKRNFSLKADTLSVLEQFPDIPDDRVFYVTASFTDYPGEDNYYKLFEVTTIYSTNPETGVAWKYNSSSSLFNKMFFTDKGMDGKEISQRTEGTYEDSYSSQDSDPDSIFMKIYLLNTEKSYYQFHQSLLNYSAGEIPFSEVSPLYSNITGGLGIFSSYTVDSVIVRLK